MSTGITGDSSLDCHNALKVGNQLQQHMIAKATLLPPMKRKVKVMTLDIMTSSTVMHGQEGTVSPSRTE